MAVRSAFIVYIDRAAGSAARQPVPSGLFVDDVAVHGPRHEGTVVRIAK
jgi:hypothetical protein